MSDVIKFQSAAPPSPPMSESAGHDQFSDSIEFGELINALRDTWRVGLIAGGVVTIVVLFIFLQMTPVYTARAVVVLETRDQEIVNVDNVLSSLKEDADVLETEVKIIGSSRIAEQVVDRLELGNDDEFGGRNANSGAGGETQELGRRKRREAIIRKVRDDLLVYRDGKSFALNLEFSSADPERAAQISNAFAETYVESQAAEKRAATIRANELLRVQLNTLAAAVQTSEAEVEAYRTQAGLLDADGSTLIEQQNQAIAAELSQLENELAGHRAKLNTLNSLKEAGLSADTMASMVTSPLMVELRTQKAEVEREHANLMAKYGPRHPSLVSATSRLGQINNSIKTEVDRMSESIRVEAETNQKRMALVEARSIELRSALSDTRRAEVRLRELERQAETDRTLYENFLSRFKETAAQQELQQGDARIISVADIPTGPSWPKTSIMLLTAGTLGIGSGIAAVFFSGLFSTGLRTPRDLERATGYPCLATLPHIGKTRFGFQKDGMYHQSRYLENIKAIYLDVMRRMTEQDGSAMVVSIISSMPGEAKTSTVISLAQAAADRGLRTLCIDGDDRRQKLSSKFLKFMPLATKTFVMDYEGNPVFARTSKSGNLSVLLAKDLFGGRAELDGDRYDAILNCLRKSFDLIIIDTPPIMALVDARRLAHSADISYLTLRWRKTPKSLLTEAMTVAQRANIKIGGTILTRIAPNRSGVYAPYYDAKTTKHMRAYFEDPILKRRLS